MTQTNNHVTEHFPAYLSGDLDPRLAKAIEGHIGSCAQCRQELDSFRELWNVMAELPEPAPSPALSSRFYDSLKAYESAGKAAQRRTARLQDSEAVRFLRHPAFQFAWTAAVLAIGIFLGKSFNAPPQQSTEISQVQGELRAMERMLTVSLLQQQSASERLKGVSYSYRVQESDADVTSALLHTLSYDGNVNVRLAALDALSRHAEDESILREILNALPRQSSPLVQIATVDFLVQLHYKPAVSVMKAMVTDPKLNDTVKEHIKQRLQLLA